ncbi:pyrroline-5-carboxylate reductase [Metschnikowia bicuspidata var. bicuspidata NRRL YB-4993]|uniref:Pyrroline-5-carboxylate reductase n=1 Tax=Metschnikowia bicuspidata var. bicuspidata NRRL YB-4993 TaxID=869754 RepID=A0A1A0HEG8_9ASCO|nr:pyrroline-5-carboxylate reductase [Metschnikowia bicuspidata var. bicuspidata NRRL YB-4993]OBA22298.1 pyrroline-5-carboxylate reductase [Metschnikowia bicuspidata var. bicuspidata NRRL YB-4993]
MALSDGFTLVVMGAGVMGTTFTSAILNSNVSPYPGKIHLCLKSDGNSKALKEAYPQDFVEVHSDTAAKNRAVASADVVILGCKPFHYKAVYQEIRGSLGHATLLISLLAGVTIEQLRVFTPNVARVMTNTPARYGCGMATVAFAESASEDQRALVLGLAGTLGTAMEIPEKNMDAATALVGSGPAFCLLMMEALYDGGVRMGLQHEVARTAAAKVMEGTAKMVLETGEHPAVLKSKVCTPGGTTIGGLLKMEDAGVRGAISRAVEEAAEISASFAK